jgi:hypothetical protein
MDNVRVIYRKIWYFVLYSLKIEAGVAFMWADYPSTSQYYCLLIRSGDKQQKLGVFLTQVILYCSVEGAEQKQTACYDIDVEVDDTLKTQMNNFLLSTASQQEIQVTSASLQFRIVVVYSVMPHSSVDGISVLEESTASVFKAEDEVNRFLQNSDDDDGHCCLAIKSPLYRLFYEKKTCPNAILSTTYPA